MWSVFEKLCNEKGVSTNAVAKATGIPQTTLANWKKRNNYLNTKAAQKIADYFGVSLQYLMTGMDLTPEQQLIHAIEPSAIKSHTVYYFEDSELKNLIETVKDAPDDVLVRLRYYAEGLMAAERDRQHETC